MSASPAPLPPDLSLPATMCAGDLCAWSVLTSLPSGSAVSYFLTAVIGNAAVRIVAGPVAVNDAGVAAFSFASSITAAWQPGRYQWMCFAFDLDGNRSTLAEGQILVQPDPTAAMPARPRTDNERLLANIRSLLQGKGLEDAVMYKIGTRELTKMPVKDLLYFEGVIEARVGRERRRRAGLPNTANSIGITFGGC